MLVENLQIIYFLKNASGHICAGSYYPSLFHLFADRGGLSAMRIPFYYYH